MKRAPMRLAAATLLVALPMAAAADSSADQAAKLRTELQQWAAGVVGPDVKIPANLIQVAPEGDHYRVAIALGALPDIVVAEGGTISAAAYPGENGKWRIDELRFTSPSKFAVGNSGAGKTPTEVTASIANMQGKGVLDPSFASPTTFDMKLGGYDVSAVNPKTQFHTRLDNAAGQMSLTPSSAGRIDFKESATADNYVSQQKSGAHPAVDFAAKHMGAHLSVASLDPTRVLAFIHALTRLSATAMSEEASAHGGKPGAPAGHHHDMDSAANRKAVRDAYLAFRGIASGGELNETVDGVRVAGAGHMVGLDHLGLGGGIATPGGTLRARLTLDLAGLSSPEIPPDVRKYLPRHFAITPSVSGVNLAGLDALIMAATAPQPDDQDVDAKVSALMAHGIAVGLDKLAFDLGPANFSGHGKLMAFSPEKFRGEAEVKATGFDTLMQEAMTTKELAQGVPVLAMMRSLAKPEGDALVWAVRMENSVVTVNGHDLASMFGGRKRRTAPGNQ